MDVATMTTRRRYDRPKMLARASARAESARARVGLLEAIRAAGLVVCSDTTAEEPLVRLIVAKP